MVKDIFTDFKRHDLGPNFYERNWDGTMQTQFLTRPLWGVGSTGPYGHDGRSMTLNDVILRHGGEAQASRDKYAANREWRTDRVADVPEFAAAVSAGRYGVEPGPGRSDENRLPAIRSRQHQADGAIQRSDRSGVKRLVLPVFFLSCSESAYTWLNPLFDAGQTHVAAI